MPDKLINIKDIIQYGFYDDNGELEDEKLDYIVVLDKEKLKKIFNADDIVFKEI